MHTIIVLVLGLSFLGVCVLVGNVFGGHRASATAALVFVPLWFIGAGTNMFIGVTRAGYGVWEEAPLFLLVFGIPASIAVYAWARFR